MSGVANLKPRPIAAPVNPLCTSDAPSDVINAAASVVRMIQLLQRMESEGEAANEDIRSGSDYALGMVHEALLYAKDIAVANQL